MQTFYTPQISGKNYILNKEESKHCIRVLRLKKGDDVNLVDGNGGFYIASISEENPNACLLEIKEVILNFEKRNYYLHLAVAPTKNIDRIEWMIEKAVETGIDEFTPVICEHSERKSINVERLERIAISAMKQSLKAFLPKINDCISFSDFIHKKTSHLKLIAHCFKDIKPQRKLLKDAYQKNQNVVCMVGPEGDFSREEVNFTVKNGYTGVSLGPGRFRTETAGLVVCQNIYFMNL